MLQKIVCVNNLIIHNSENPDNNKSRRSLVQKKRSSFIFMMKHNFSLDYVSLLYKSISRKLLANVTWLQKSQFTRASYIYKTLFTSASHFVDSVLLILNLKSLLLTFEPGPWDSDSLLLKPYLQLFDHRVTSWDLDFPLLLD